MEKIVEVTKEELENGCKKKVFIDGEFIEVEIPKNSEDKTRIAIEVEDEDGKKEKINYYFSFNYCISTSTKRRRKSGREFWNETKKKRYEISLS